MIEQRQTREIAAALAAFVDVLIPGDDLFPAASAVGAHGLLWERLRDFYGAEMFDKLIEALSSEGGFLDTLPPAAQLEAVRRLEHEKPDLFNFLRMVTYYAYYQSPPVVQAICALGHDYHDAPQPLGYAMVPFDPSVNVPAAPRGRYRPTDQIVRLDLSGIDLTGTN